MKAQINKLGLLFFVFLFSSFIFTLSSCKKSTEPIYNQQTLQLTLADVSCTEAWLKLKAQIAQKDSSDLKLQLYRNDSLIVNKPLTATESLLYVDGLQPATSYAFAAKVLNSSKLLAVSAKVEATTMDTTSHNFTWQTWKFGKKERGSSLYDVAIIDENDIWAVGEIHTKDTDRWNEDSTKWLQPYNAAHWNGEKWELKKIDWDGIVSELTCVYAFSNHDVWFGVTNLIHWNGTKFQKNWNPVLIQFSDKIVNKIWGTSANDLFIVGNKGMIAHYDGKQWQRIESETNVRLLDIYGTTKVWICGWKDLQPTVLLNIDNGNVSKIIESENILNENSLIKISGGIFSLWTDAHDNLYVLTWNSLYRCYHGDVNQVKALWNVRKPSQWAYRKVRGNSANDIVTVGDRGRILHFNGVTWKQFNNLLNKHDYLYSVSVKGNLIVAVGERYINGIESYGIIYVGKR